MVWAPYESGGLEYKRQRCGAHHSRLKVQHEQLLSSFWVEMQCSTLENWTTSAGVINYYLMSELLTELQWNVLVTKKWLQVLAPSEFISFVGVCL